MSTGPRPIRPEPDLDGGDDTDEFEIGASEVGLGAAAALARGGRDARPAEGPSMDALDRADRASDVDLKPKFGYTMLVLMVGQAVLANVAFFWFAIANDWHFDPSVMNFWISGAVVEIFLLARVVTRSLFPPEPPRPRQPPV